MAIAAALIVSMLPYGAVLSATPQTASAFTAANRDYAEGRLAQAVNGYSSLLAQNGYSASVLFNRGNAWRRLNQPGRAVLDYERALWLGASNSGAIAANLKIAQQQAGVAGIRPTLLDLSLTGFAALTWIAEAAALIMAVAALAARATRSRWAPAIRGLAAVGAVMFIAAGAILAMRWPELDRAVVLDAGTPVHIAPAQAADISFRLLAGDLVQIDKRYAAYVAVHTADGHSGWVDARQIAQIVPAAEDSESKSEPGVTPSAANSG
jgi:tetratricopeptide (TPR) repeat protein